MLWPVSCREATKLGMSPSHKTKSGSLKLLTIDHLFGSFKQIWLIDFEQASMICSRISIYREKSRRIHYPEPQLNDPLPGGPVARCLSHPLLLPAVSGQEMSGRGLFPSTSNFPFVLFRTAPKQTANLSLAPEIFYSFLLTT